LHRVAILSAVIVVCNFVVTNFCQAKKPIVKMQRQLANLLGNVTRQVRSNHRAFSVTTQRREIFKVQSSEDFDKKVKKSQEPVVVDFFAT